MIMIIIMALLTQIHKVFKPYKKIINKIIIKGHLESLITMIFFQFTHYMLLIMIAQSRIEMNDNALLFVLFPRPFQYRNKGNNQV